MSALTEQERKDRAAHGHYTRTYGVSLEWYNTQDEKQGRVCGICGKPKKTKRLAVDHNHRTGKVRGLLCMMCNRKILGVMEKLRVCPIWVVKYLMEYDPDNPLNRGEGWQMDTGRPARKKRKK